MQSPGLLTRLVDSAGRAAGYFFVVIVGITAYEVVMRYVFKAPTIWVHEITVVLAAAAFVIAGPYVHARRGHIAITYFVERMPSGTRRVVTLVSSLITLVCLAFLAYAAVDQAHVSLRDMETSGTALNIHTPVFLKTLFAVACVVLTVQTIVHVIQDLLRLRERDQ